MADVKITITAEDQTKAAFSAVESGAKSAFDKVESSATGMTGKIKSAFESLKTHWLAVAAGIAAAGITVSNAWSLAEKAAGFQEQKAALNSLAAQYNTTASEIISSVKEASNGLISMADAASVSAKALMMGLNPQQITDFMKVVEATTNVTGQSVSAAFESIVEAAAAGRERALKQMGIMVDLNAAYKDHAAKLGKTTDALTEVEKQQAAVNAILGKSGDILKQLGDQGDSTADKMERFKVMMADASLVLGDILIRAAAGASAALFGFSAVFNGAIGGIALGFQKLFELGAKIPVLRKMFDPLASAARAVSEQFLGAAKIASDNVVTSWDAMVSSGDKAAKGTQGLAGSIKDAAAEDKKRAEQAKKTIETLKDYSTAAKEAGQDALKFAENRFSEKMKEQERSIDGMKGAMREYEGTINNVYGSQIKALGKIKDAMREAGADPKEIKAQGVAILEAEKAQATAKLGAWQKYYEGLKALQASAIDEMQKKIDAFNETKKLEKDFFAGLNEKFHPKEALDPYQQFWSDMERIDQASTEAMKLEGEEKKKALKDVLESLKNLPEEVTIDGETVISHLFVEEKIKEQATGIIDAIKEVDQAAIDSAANLVSESGAAILKTGEDIEGLKGRILDLSDQLTALRMQVDTSQAESAISRIISSIPPVIYTSVSVSGGGAPGGTASGSSPSSWSGELSGYSMQGGYLLPEGPGYASGTSYVPATGYYQLHQGEQVLTRSEVTNNQQSRSISIQMGDIVIQGVNKSPEQLAREIAKPLNQVMKRLGYLQ